MGINQRRAAARAKYSIAHCCCPNCGCDSIETTCVGCVSSNPDEHYDDNRASCVCGWRGIVDNLVPRSE